MTYRLAVDLGTTWTAAAVHDGGRPTMVGLGNRALQVPSVVLVGSSGEILVGEAAERRAVLEPDRVVREFKRRIADPVPIFIEGAPFSPKRLTAEVLKWVVARTTERSGSAPAELTLTYPASWGSYRRGVLDDVCALAEIDQKTVTYRTEPEAAAAQYAFRAGTTARGSLLVYDLGGGTFDVCVLSAVDGAYVTVGRPAGLDTLGGIDFDEMIFRRVIQSWAPEGLDSADLETVAALNRLRRECTDAKEALSSDVDVTIPVAVPGMETRFRLLRHEFEDMIRPAIQQTVAHTRTALQASGCRPADLQAVVLVGGSSRIPLVSEILFRELGVPVALDTHPKHDVALGATLTPGRRAPATPVPPRAGEQASTRVPARAGRQTGDRPKHRPDAAARLATPLTEQELRPTARVSSAVTSSARWRRGARRPVVALVVVLVGLVAVYSVVRGPSARDDATVASSTRGTPSAAPADPTAEPSVPRSATPLSDRTMIWPRVRDGVWGIGSMSLSGEQVRVAQDPSLDSSFPVLSPDRRSVVYLRETTEQWSLRVAAADGSDDRALLTSLPGCRRVEAPAWGPRGLLALPCQKSSGAGTVLQLVTLGGQVESILDRGFLGDPTFSPDGRTIVYWRNDYGSSDGGALFRIAVDNGARQRLTDGGDGVDDDPVISPDGRTVAYRTKRDGRMVIATIPLPTTASGAVQEPRVLSRGRDDEQEPSWSPDGQQIAFVRGLGDAREIDIMNRDGTHRRALTHDHEADAAPAWSSR